MEAVAAGENDFDAVDKVHDAAETRGKRIGSGVGDEGADGFAGVGVNWEHETMSGEGGV